jgi:hypothetical protein
MKATVDIPDALYRRIKARSALEGRTVREVTIELYEQWLRDGSAEGAGTGTNVEVDADRWLERWEALGSEIAQRAAEGRTTREILVADRR